jgi:voltage-gated potassium channel
VSKPLSRVIYGILFFILTCLIGIIGYVIYGWSIMDSVYMVIITIFGVGYGEVKPIESSSLRVFTIMVIVGGYAAAIYAVGGFIQILTEGEIHRALGARKMSRGIDKLNNHTIICGFGRIGRILARQLHETKSKFVVIDTDRSKVEEAESNGYLALIGDASSEDVLDRSGVIKAKTLATVLPQDSSNVFIALTAREMNRHLEIIARAEDPSSERKLRHSGATKVVLPAAIGAERIANLIIRPGADAFLQNSDSRTDLMEELLNIGLQFDELRIPEKSALVGKKVEDIELHGNRGFLIVGVRHADETLIVNPTGDTPLKQGDTVIVVGHTEDLPKLRYRYELERKKMYRGTTLG